MKRSSVYIETTVISYLLSRPSQNIKVAGEQLITQDWWNKTLPKLNPFISTFVLDEISVGDKEQVKKRIEVISKFEVLQQTSEVKEFAQVYIKTLQIPAKSKIDAFHLAIASIFEMDFIVSWNCKHIANPFLTNKIIKVNKDFSLPVPVICTPREMLGE